MFFRVVFLFILSVLAVSCTSVNIDSAKPISVPTGLTIQEVKLAIVRAVSPQSSPPELNQYQEITDRALRAHFGFRYQSANQKGRWFIERIEGNSVFVGFDNRKHYFGVEYVIENHQVSQKIDGSRNLGQSDTRIHKAVFRWLGEMESNIRQQMWNVKSYKGQQTSS